MAYSFQQLKDILAAAGWPSNLQDMMASIGLLESSGNPAATRFCPGPSCGGQTTPEQSYGLWQINMLAPENAGFDRTRLVTDPVYNAQAAYQVYQRQGVRAWLNSFRKYMAGGGVSPDQPGGGLRASGMPATLSGILGLDQLSNYLLGPTDTPLDRYKPYANVKLISNQQRMLLASVIVIVILAFAWNEF